MVKAGQVYKNIINGEEYYRYVVTYTYPNGKFLCVFKDGSTSLRADKLKRGDKKVAEYPDWKKAVNSKEFIND